MTREHDPNDARVDVIVATRNRPDDLRKMLESLTQQTHQSFRVLIVDQSDDVHANRAAIEQLGDLRFEHVVDPSRGKSLALNLGIEATHSELIASTDDDCVADPHWLSELVRAAQSHEQAGVVFGNLIPAPHDPDVDFIPAIEFSEPKLIAGMPRHAPGLLGMGANMLVRRSALRSTGVFDVDLGPGGRLRTGEEVELTFRMLRRGFAVLQYPEARVVHHGARPISDGVARRLVTDGFFAVAAGLGKHARSGDIVAARVWLQELGVGVRMGAAALIRRRPPYQARRLLRLVQGFAAGLRAGSNVPSTSISQSPLGAKPNPF